MSRGCRVLAASTSHGEFNYISSPEVHFRTVTENLERINAGNLMKIIFSELLPPAIVLVASFKGKLSTRKAKNCS